MNIAKDAVLLGLSNAVVDMDIEKVELFACEAIKIGLTAEEAILNGLARGMEEVSELYRQDIYYVPEVVVCGDTMYAGLEILKPFLENQNQSLGKIVIGVVEGDSHDIGKNVVAMMLKGAGFEVYDLGRDVPLHFFIDKALEVNADIIAMSCLLSTARTGMKVVIDDLHSRNLQKKPYIIVGGAVISPAFAESIGADGYSADACEAVRLAKKLMRVPESGGNN